ncbi:hypothetical protein OK016_24570 [Vibrio chagasii]|nr:hypothetical protein [Vibrio chagasii]
MLYDIGAALLFALNPWLLFGSIFKLAAQKRLPVFEQVYSESEAKKNDCKAPRCMGYDGIEQMMFMPASLLVWFCIKLSIL